MARSTLSSTSKGKPKSSSSKRSRTSSRPKVPLKARLLAAVYRISKRKTSPPRTASHAAIKKHLLARESSHPDRYARFNPTSLLRIKQELTRAGNLSRPTTGSFGVDKDVKKILQAQEGADQSDSSGDELAAKAYFSTPQKQKKGGVSSSAPSRPRKLKVTATDSSDNESSTSAISVRVSMSGKKRSRTPSVRSRTEQPAAAPRKSRSSTRRLNLQFSSDDDDDEQLDSEAEVVAPPAKSKGRKSRSKTVRVSSSPAPSPRKKAKTGDGLSHLRKVELIDRVEQLRKRNGELAAQVEGEKERADALVHEKSVLSKGFLELRTLHEALRARLSRYENVEEDAIGTQQISGSTEPTELDQDFGVMSDQEDFGGMEQTFGGPDDDAGPYYEQGEETEYAEVKVGPVEGSADTTIIPDSQAERAERVESPPRPRFSTVHQTIEEPTSAPGVDSQNAVSFTSSYPELEVDTQPRAEPRPTRTPPPQQEPSWASVHPPSPAASQHGDTPRAADLAEVEQEVSAEQRGTFPTPDLSSSPIKRLGSHTIEEPAEGSVLAPTVIDEETEGQLEMELEEDDAARSLRLEQELVEVRVELGEMELSKDIVRQEIDLVSRRYQDQVDSARAQSVLYSERISTLERQLQEIVHTSEAEQLQVSTLIEELRKAKDALATAEEGRVTDQARLESTKAELDVVCSHHRASVADSTERLDKLMQDHETLQSTAQNLEKQLVSSGEQHSLSQAQVKELERSLEQARSEYEALVKIDSDRQAAFTQLNVKLDELTTKIEALEAAQVAATEEKTTLETRIGTLEGEISSAQRGLEDASAEFAQQLHRSTLLQAELDLVSSRHQDQLEDLAAELRQSSAETKDLEYKVASLVQTLSATEARADEYQKAEEELQAELDEANSSHDAAKHEIQSRVSTLEDSIGDLTQELDETRSAHTSAIIAVSSTESELAVVRQQLAQTSASLNAEGRRAGSLKAEIDLISTHYRDEHETNLAQIEELEANLAETEEKVAVLDTELSEQTAASEELESRVRGLEQQLSDVERSHAELTKVDNERQVALAESSRRIDILISELYSVGTSRASLFEEKASLLQDISRLTNRLELASADRDEQVRRIQTLQLEIGLVSRAYQDRQAETKESLSEARKEQAQLEEDIMLLQEELNLTHTELLKEQAQTEELSDRVEGVTQSYNALVLEKEALQSTLSKVQHDKEHLSTQVDALTIDLDILRAKKSSLEAHSLATEQDLVKAEGELHTTRDALELEKHAAEKLKTDLVAETESHSDTSLQLKATTDRLERLQTAYDVVVAAESELRASLRTLVIARGQVPSFSENSGIAYISALERHFIELDQAFNATSSLLKSAMSITDQLLAAFPPSVRGSPAGCDNDIESSHNLEEKLKEVLRRVGSTIQKLDSVSTELEETKSNLEATCEDLEGAQTTVDRQSRLLGTVRSKMLEVKAVFAVAEDQTSVDLGLPAEDDVLSSLIAQIKTHVLSSQYSVEERQGEVHRLTLELEEEVAKRNRAVARLSEKTRECQGLQERVVALTNRRDRALSLFKQGSDILEGAGVDDTG